MMLRMGGSVVGGSKKILGRRVGGLVLTLTLLAGVGCDTNITDRDIEFISVGEAMVLGRESPDATIFLDPRPGDSFQQGHIPGARNLRLPEVPPNSAKERGLDEADMLIVYGDSHHFMVHRPFPATAGNIVALEVYGETDMNAVSITVNPADAAVFSFTPVINPNPVPKS